MRAAERAYGLRVANARGRDGAGQQASAEQRRPEGRRWQPAEQQRWSRPAARVRTVYGFQLISYTSFAESMFVSFAESMFVREFN